MATAWWPRAPIGLWSEAASQEPTLPRLTRRSASQATRDCRNSRKKDFCSVGEYIVAYEPARVFQALCPWIGLDVSAFIRAEYCLLAETSGVCRHWSG